MKQARLNHESEAWLERFARFGYVAKGVVYILIGVLSAMAALRVGGEITGTKGALVTIVEQPFGRLLLAVIAVGLAGYVLWRFTQAFLDADRKGNDARGLAVRAFYTASALIYGSLTLAAARLLVGGGSGEEGSSLGGTAELMSKPFGRWLVGAAGALLLGVAGYQFYRSVTAKFRKRLKSGEMSDMEETWATRIGRFGFAARGVVFAVMGLYLIRAALDANPGKARNLEGALRELENQPYGPLLLAVTAVGLVAFGVFQLVFARYRDIRIE
jgi:hypothetical protein